MGRSKPVIRTNGEEGIASVTMMLTGCSTSHSSQLLLIFHCDSTKTEHDEAISIRPQTAVKALRPSRAL